MLEARSVQITAYDTIGEIPRIIEDLPRQGNAPDAILKAKATLLLYKHSKLPMTRWQRLNNRSQTHDTA